MRIRIIILFLVMVLAPGAVVFCLFDKAHNFDQANCVLCHEDSVNYPARLKTISSSICLGCHDKVKQILSHPYDILPGHKVPEDMPLVNGRLSCVSCHFVHPFSISRPGASYFLLRRPGRGAVFCGTCHQIDGRGHFVFDKAHKGSYKLLDKTGSLDPTSLQCIECHIDHLPRTLKQLGPGAWAHESRFIHPVGISYNSSALRKPKKFKAAVRLNSAIRLYDGKIGCGTCHSPYGKRKGLLVVDNHGSQLCLNCHSK